MEEIPEDVRATAEAFTLSLSKDWPDKPDAFTRAYATNRIAELLASERERCAKVADDMEALSVDSSEWDAGYRCALDAVAAAIRSGVHP